MYRYEWIWTNITRARARSHLRVWFHYVQIKHDDSKPIGLPSLAMPLQGTMPPPARASFTWRSIQWKWLPQKSNAPVPLATPGVFRNLDTLWCCRVPVVILQDFFILSERHGAFIFANKYRNVECDVSVLMKRAIKQNVWTWRSSLFVPHTRTCP